MTLNSSGPISIGGATVGQSINLELGRSASSQSALNETALGTLAGKPVGAINLADFYGKYKVWNYVAAYSGLNEEGILQRGNSAINPIGESYVTGSKFGNLYIAKHDIKGDPIWRKIVTTHSSAVDCAIDENENVYSISNTRDSNSGLFVVDLIKHTSSGDLVWTYRYAVAGQQQRLGSIHIDNNNNIFVIGYAQPTVNTTHFIFILKFDTNGNIIWQKRIGEGSSNNLFPRCVTTNSDGSIYIGGIRVEGISGSSRAMLIKLTSTGAFSWCRYIENTEYPPGDFATGLAILGIETDSSGNIYATGGFRNDITTPIRYNAAGIWKFSSSGSLLWQRVLGTDKVIGGVINLDSTGNIYVLSLEKNPISSNYDRILIINITDTGNLIWQKSFYINILAEPINFVVLSSQIIYDSRYGFYFCGAFGSDYRLTSGDRQYSVGLFGLNTDSNFTISLPSLTYTTSSHEFITPPAKFANLSATYASTNAAFVRSSPITTVVDITDNTDKTVVLIS